MTILEKAGLLLFILAVANPAGGVYGPFLFVLMLAGLTLFMQGDVIDAAIEKWNQEEKKHDTPL